MTDAAIIVLAVAGTFFAAVGSIGVWRLPDLYCRMHAQTKGSTLGLVGLLLAAASYFGEPDVWVKAVFTILFQFLTAPTGAHLISRAAHARRVEQWVETRTDELHTAKTRQSR